MALRSRLSGSADGSRSVRVVLTAVTAVLVSAAVAVAASSGALTASIEPEPAIVVTDDRGEEIVVSPVGEETEIVLEYTHSVEKTLVRDVYVAVDGQLVSVRMEFSSFGAGLPSQATVTQRDGRYVYEPPRVEYEALRVKTGVIADHDLIVGGNRYDIAALADGGAVEITVQQRRRIFT
ncbi:hypothetical protein J2751_000190 [Halorubrum alkaliphilum]|uniref:DUF1850 domain-containing protein n=1 Tax=Halorubrum alkaliphilum TaxID=261290 RepID=A0A8T4GBJ9_9EURY|nr:hypothetical protein [Halorubrum alkaliphilum]